MNRVSGELIIMRPLDRQFPDNQCTNYKWIMTGDVLFEMQVVAAIKHSCKKTKFTQRFADWNLSASSGGKPKTKQLTTTIYKPKTHKQHGVSQNQNYQIVTNKLVTVPKREWKHASLHVTADNVPVVLTLPKQDGGRDHTIGHQNVTN